MQKGNNHHHHKRRRHPRHIPRAARRRHPVQAPATAGGAGEETPALRDVQAWDGGRNITHLLVPHPQLPQALPVVRGASHHIEAATARLVVWAMGEEHRPARIHAARSAAECILCVLQTPSPRRIAGQLSEEQTRELLLNALRGVCRRPGLVASARQLIRRALRALAALLGRKPAATLTPITIDLE